MITANELTLDCISDLHLRVQPTDPRSLEEVDDEQ